jgi:hypothetical protein
MSVMITTERTPRRTTVRIAGRLEAGDLPELLRVFEGQARPLELDLSELLTADADALEVLRRQHAAGAMLVGLSPYVRLLLGDPPGELGR